MGTIDEEDTEVIVAAMLLLRDNLYLDLEDIEQRIKGGGVDFYVDDELGPDQLLNALRRGRTQLLSGLLSVDEVLGWTRVYAPKDADGNELECVRELPRVTITPMH
jgi:hypothetical protein